MPILALDKNGQIYVTSADRSDGYGMGSRPSQVERRDNTLDNSYLKSEARQAKENHQIRAANLTADALARQGAEIERRRQLAKRKAAAQAQEIRAQTAYQQGAIRQALMNPMMGCECKLPLSGSTLSANGLEGYDGMDENQKTIHRHLMGLGEAPIGLSDTEAAQIRLRNELMRRVHSRAVLNKSRARR